MITLVDSKTTFTFPKMYAVFFSLLVLMQSTALFGINLPNSLQTHCNKTVINAHYMKHTGQCFAMTQASPDRANSAGACQIEFDEMKNGRLAIIGTNMLLDNLKLTWPNKAWTGLVQVNTSEEPKGGWKWVDSRNGKCSLIQTDRIF